ncbi:hypothetical protein PG994_001915 [Apiospora phragmitis]|uniref:Uncharacterized protein n=1 Tax=Apiospora phragmitis TaxID=2905665 RepID=A0ABR1WUW6_9PEZI
MLKGQKNNNGVVVDANTLWPPAHLSNLDIAHLCQHDVHTALFGITTEKPGAMSNYPTDQDNPVTVPADPRPNSLGKEPREEDCSLGGKNCWLREGSGAVDRRPY